ncbi:MAG TPA: hypothetical protein VGB30_07795 [bacterium]
MKPENMYYSTDDGNSLYPNIYNLYTSDLITDEFISNKYWIDIGGYYGAPGSLSPDMSPVQWIIILPSQNNGFIYVITNRFVHPLDPKFELRRYPYTQLNKIYSGLTRFSDMDEIPVTVIATYTYENAGTITSVNTL